MRNTGIINPILLFQDYKFNFLQKKVGGEQAIGA